jgi:protein angel
MASEYRRTSILNEIKSYIPHVICLQEVEDYAGWSCALGALGYDGCYKQRTDGKVEGCATFVYREALQIIDIQSIQYGDYPVVHRDELATNVALLTRLQTKTTNGYGLKRQLLVANTHLLWNPRRGNIKLAQLQSCTFS